MHRSSPPQKAYSPITWPSSTEQRSSPPPRAYKDPIQGILASSVAPNSRVLSTMSNRKRHFIDEDDDDDE
jgi:hypothetical protein